MECHLRGKSLDLHSCHYRDPGCHYTGSAEESQVRVGHGSLSHCHQLTTSFVQTTRGPRLLRFTQACLHVKGQRPRQSQGVQDVGSSDPWRACGACGFLGRTHYSCPPQRAESEAVSHRPPDPEGTT